MKSNTQAQRIAFSAKGRVIVERFELRALGPDDILVENEYSTISPGTELAFLHEYPDTLVEYPCLPGYCSSGRIAQVGQAVTEFTQGMRVAMAKPHASAVVLSAEECVPVPDHVSGLEASACKLGAIAIQAVYKAQVRMGNSVVVLGLGIIGNLAGQLARAAGATHVVGIDSVNWRRELALQCGFDATFASADDFLGREHHGQGNPSHAGEIVIEATGNPQAINLAFQIAPRLGVVVLLGSTRGLTQNVNFYRDVHKKGITIIGAHDSIRSHHGNIDILRSRIMDMNTVMDLLAGGRIRIKPLIGQTTPAEDAQATYDKLKSAGERLLTIALKWRD